MAVKSNLSLSQSPAAFLPRQSLHRYHRGFQRVLRNILAIAAVAFLAVGCGPDRPPVYPVSGKVTGGSGSLEGVVVTFAPLDETGIPASGTIGADGSYALQSGDGRDGAVPGEYKVTLSPGPEASQKAMMQAMQKKGRSGPPKMDLPFPRKYRDPKTSDKTVEVKPESNVIDISL